jgi:hypothetical protein
VSQSIIRGYITRRAYRIANRLRNEERAALGLVRMQATIRGMLYRCKRVVANARKRIAAAVRIQCVVRRYLAQMRVQVRCDAVVACVCACVCAVMCVRVCMNECVCACV